MAIDALHFSVKYSFQGTLAALQTAQHQ